MTYGQPTENPASELTLDNDDKPSSSKWDSDLENK